MKRPFIETLVCTSRANCATCRSKEGGRVWREQQGVYRELPGGEVDFQCTPLGLPWDESPTAPTTTYTRPPRDAREQLRVIVICDDCEEQKLFEGDQPGCKLMKKTESGGSCCPNLFEQAVASGAPCPHPSGDKWAAPAVTGLNELEAAATSDR